MAVIAVSFVLRLVSDRLIAGEIVGEVESVRDGEHAMVRDTDELRAFLIAAASRTGGYPDEIQPS